MCRQILFASLAALTLSAALVSRTIAAHSPHSTEPPNVQTPNAQKPNAQQPNAKTPNSQKPNAQQPNAQQPNAQQPNAQQPNAQKTNAQQPKRIGVFALPYFSHANMLTQVALELRRRGHAVSVVFSAGFSDAPEAKLRAAGADVLRYRVPYDKYVVTDASYLQRVFVGYTSDEVHGASEFAVDDGGVDISECRYLLADRELFARLRAARFDLVVIDGLCFYRCLALVPQLLGGLPFVTSITIVEPWLLGVAALPSHFPTPFSALAADHMTFGGRLWNTLQTIRWHETIRSLDNFYLYTDSLEPQDAARIERFLTARQSPAQNAFWCALFGAVQLLTGTLERFQADVGRSCVWGGRYLSLGPLVRNASLWLVDTDSELVDSPLPLLPHVVEMSGLTTEREVDDEQQPASSQAQQQIPPAISTFIEAADSVVIVSLGTIMQHITQEFNDMLLRAMKSCPEVRFIWRVHDVQFSEPLPPNLFTAKWLPQRELLLHPKTRAFVTHGGKNSVFESLYAGVPMIVLAVFGDQLTDATRIAERQYGLYVRWKGLTAEKLASAIHEVVQNSSYRQTIADASQLYREKYRGKRKAVDAIERVLRVGSRLRPPHTELEMPQLFLFDVLLFLYGLVFSACFVLLFLFYCLCKFCVRRVRMHFLSERSKSKRD